MSRRNKRRKITSSHGAKVQKAKQLEVIDALLRLYAKDEEGKKAFLEQHKSAPPPPCLVTEHHAPGVYLREITMPKGLVICGKRHATTHFNIIVKGAVRCIDEEGNAYTLKAPYRFVSPAGMRKMFAVLEECVWQTIHPNPENITETSELEKLLITPDSILTDRKSLPQ